MSIQTIILSEELKNYPISFDREKPYCKVLEYKLLGDVDEEEIKKIPISFGYQVDLTEGRNTRGPFGSFPFFEARPIDARGAKAIYFYFQLPDNYKDLKIEIEFTVEILDRFDIKSPTAAFDEHIQDPRNVKILFSAPFGQGKSTFIDFYFKEKIELYNVFKLYPVNYSVASNQDIFRYIKADILFQLLESSDTRFEEVVKGYDETFYAFFRENADKILAPFLLMIPAIGKSAYTMFEKLNALKEAYFKVHEDAQISESEEGAKFIKELIEEEGSIYESNFYTILIRNLLKRLKDDQPQKENVLVIDDLDRMDPEHIFRILNIISAHYDIFRSGADSDHNKFGFDRIILVCDYVNLKFIYEHRYGEQVNFSGYINKYYSSTKFDFENTEIYASLIGNIDNLRPDLPALSQSKLYFNFRLISSALLDSDQLSLRELLKLRSIGLRSRREVLRKSSYFDYIWFKFGSFSPTIMLLSELADTELIIRRLKSLKEAHFRQRIDYNDLCMKLIGAAIPNKNSQVVNIKYKETNYLLSITFIQDNEDFAAIQNYQLIDPTNEQFVNIEVQFFFEDFIGFLIENFRKYNSFKHLL